MKQLGKLHNLHRHPEAGCIHANVLRILAEVGMQIHNSDLLTVLADFGLPVNLSEERVRFPGQTVERFLAEAEPHDWQAHRPRVSASAGVYHSTFQNPETNELEPWTEERLAFYFALARSLPAVGSAA